MGDNEIVLGTFKLVKTNLQRLGYSKPDASSTDRIFIWMPSTKCYSELTDEKRSELERGEKRINL